MDELNRGNNFYSSLVNLGGNVEDLHIHIYIHGREMSAIHIHMTIERLKMTSKETRKTKPFYLEERSLRGIQTSVSRRHNHINRSYKANSSRCSNLFSIKSIQYYLIKQYPTNYSPENNIRAVKFILCNTLYLATSSRTSFKSPFVKMRPTFP